MVKRTILVALALLSLAASAFAQEDTESAFATIFRGKLPATYPYRHNGTYYWDRKEFQQGDVWYNGRLYRDIFLNVDAVSGELQARPVDGVIAVVLVTDQVAWFTMGEKPFVNLRYLGWPEAPEGYFEVVRDGETPLLRRVSKTLRTDSNGSSYAIGYEDPDYDYTVNNYFRFQETFFALEQGRLKKISRKNLARRLKAPAGNPTLGMARVDWHPHTDRTPSGTVAEANLPGAGAGLPDSYFAEIQKDTITVQYADSPLLATYRNKVYTVGIPGQNKGSAANRVRGAVTEAETGEPMYGVVIYDDITKSYTRSDRNGQYRISLPAGENVLHFSAEGKEELDLRVIVHSDGALNVMMTDKVTMLKEAVVSAESMAQHRNTEMGVEKVSVKTMNKIPSAFGEGDVIKAVLTLPGVKSVGEASGGFNVRGGSADQNLILFNGSTIYNPSHLFGIFSAFNPDIVNDIELYKSSIPASYGGRVSSVLDVQSKDGNMEKWQGSAGIGLLTSRLHVEGPLSKGKTSIIAGARTTYSDWLLKRLPPESAYAGGSAGFTDANLGITHRFDEKNTLQAYAYYAIDRFSFGGDTTFNYGNLNASLVWKHRTAEGRLQVSGGYDQYRNRISAHEWGAGAYDLDTWIRQAFLRVDRTRRLTEAHELAWGVHLTGYALDPGVMAPYGDDSQVAARSLDRELAFEPALYISDTWKPTDEFSLERDARPPARAQVFPGGEPLVQGRCQLAFPEHPPDFQHLGGFADGHLETQRRPHQAHLGLAGRGRRLLDRTEHRHRLHPGGLLQEHLPGPGLPAGSDADDEPEPRRRPRAGPGPRLRRGHELKLVSNFALTHRYSFSVNVDYSTGRPVTVPYGKYYFGGTYRMAYSTRNAFRIPDYFRTDVAFNIDPGHYLKAIAHTVITIGVYNVTGRKNPYSVFFKTTPAGETKGYMLSVFATQIPYVNLNLLF